MIVDITKSRNINSKKKKKKQCLAQCWLEKIPSEVTYFAVSTPRNSSSGTTHCGRSRETATVSRLLSGNAGGTKEVYMQFNLTRITLPDGIFISTDRIGAPTLFVLLRQYSVTS
eukprot:g11943.t1